MTQTAVSSVPTLPESSRQLPLPLRWIGRVVDAMVIFIGAALILIVLTNVVLHLFHMDLAWVTEIGELMMVWVTFLGGVAAAQRHGHMTISELLDKLDPARRRWADVAVQLVCCFVLLVLFWFGCKVFASGWSSVLTTLNWPMAWQYLPLPLSAALMLVFHGWDLLLALRGAPREQRELSV